MLVITWKTYILIVVSSVVWHHATAEVLSIWHLKKQEISANRNIMNKIVFLIIVSLSQTCIGFSCPPQFQPCKQRSGAKYKHNQCYYPYNPFFHYDCLNRKNIDESIIANTKIYLDKPSNRINYFEYFPKDKNKTHIRCGNNALEKNCKRPWDKIVHCKKGKSDTIGKQISHLDVCVDFHFASANNFAYIDWFKSRCK